MENKKSPMDFNPVTTAIAILVFAVLFAALMYKISPPVKDPYIIEEEQQESVN